MRSPYTLAAVAAVCRAAGSSRPAFGQAVTTRDLEQAAADTSSWLMYGRDYHGHRFVELDEITPDNVDRLHPAWVFATGGDNRGLEATPLVHEGVIYLSADKSCVFAIDARTGAKMWGFEPEMSDEVERVYCCGSKDRGGFSGRKALSLRLARSTPHRSWRNSPRVPGSSPRTILYVFSRPFKSAMRLRPRW